MSVNQIIKKLRTERELTQNDLAAMMNCNRQKIADWERGKSTPSADDLILLSKKFNVSADYLLGLSDTPTTDKDIQFICEYTGLKAKAINELHKFAALKFSGVLSYESESKDILSLFISKRYLFDIEFLIDRYITEIKKLKKLYEELYSNLKQSESENYIIYEKIDECKNIIDLSKFKLQELNKDFLRTYDKELNEEIDYILEKINNEYQLTYEESDRLFFKVFGNYKEGENSANNPKAQPKL